MMRCTSPGRPRRDAFVGAWDAFANTGCSRDSRTAVGFCVGLPQDLDLPIPRRPRPLVLQPVRRRQEQVHTSHATNLTVLPRIDIQQDDSARAHACPCYALLCLSTFRPFNISCFELTMLQSMFVILRIAIPILPPSPFSNRVSPVSARDLGVARDWTLTLLPSPV
jgi:hypothetical protein